MERETETVLRLTTQIIRFATDHPFAATGIFGAAVGAGITYSLMSSLPQGVDGVFAPKVYQFEMSPEDLRRLLQDPSAEIRYETTEAIVVVTGEERIPLRMLPDIQQ